MTLERIKEFEKEFDAEIKRLPLLQKLPVRGVLTYLHVLVDHLLHASPLLPQQLRVKHRAVGEAMVGRLSYLVPVLSLCDRNEIGADGGNVLNVARELDHDQQQLLTLVSYAEFCAVMPDVWRGNYKVENVEDNGFVLTHVSDDQSRYETVDIVLSELAMSHVKVSPPPHYSRFDELARQPGFAFDRFTPMAKIYTDHYLANLVESPIMSDDGYLAATGVGRREFERFRAALFGIAAACQGMAMAFKRRLLRRPHDLALQNELVEWMSVNWDANFFQGLLMALADMTVEAIDGLLPLFSMDFRKEEANVTHADDGYFPPIAWIRGSVFFNPSLLQTFLPARNILYALNRLDRDRFNNVVSSHMEPELLQSAASIFRKIDNTTIASNVSWRHEMKEGELDMLVYSPSENVALHVQAKAAIPPQGARMIKALEGRIAEAVEQLGSFRKLPPAVIDEIVGNAINTKVHDVRVVDVVLTRSSCGTYKIWKQLSEVVVVNLPLLSAVVGKAKLQKLEAPLGAFSELVNSEIARVIKAINPAWVTKTLKWRHAKFTLPALDYDHEKMDRERNSMAGGA